jgi:uncharacterized protein (DUF169 family)
VENVKEIQSLLGEAWTGVNFYFTGAALPDVNEATGLRFCEAVSKARSEHLLLRPGAVSCPGANYVFGWDRGENLRNKIVAELVRRRRMKPQMVERLISQVPVFARPPAAIGLNTNDVPDLIISYCQPPTVMKFLKLWQAEFEGDNLVCDLSSILSVCGNVSIGSYLSKNVSLSFACDDAREFAGISRDRLVIGIPYPLIEKLAARNRALQNASVL